MNINYCEFKLIDKIKYDIDHSKDKEETANTFRLRQIQSNINY